MRSGCKPQDLEQLNVKPRGRFQDLFLKVSGFVAFLTFWGSNPGVPEHLPPVLMHMKHHGQLGGSHWFKGELKEIRQRDGEADFLVLGPG